MAQIDNYLAKVYSDELAPDWAEERLTWIDDLGLTQEFDRAVGEIHARLGFDDEDYSVSQVRRALLVWLESMTEDLVSDAVHHVLSPSGLGWAGFRAALDRTAPREERVPAYAAATIFTGHREFSPAALKEMIVFFASKPGGILKTKLNKLLWYADFLSFRLREVSLSGATYVHLTHGPVPDRYEIHLASLCDEEVLSLQKKPVGEFTGENLEATRAPDLTALDANAVDILEAVHRRFGRLGSRAISEMSHAEPGYLETKPGEIISYSYARGMKAVIPPVRGKWEIDADEPH